MFSIKPVHRFLTTTIAIAILSVVTPARGETPYNVAWITQLGSNGTDQTNDVSTDGLGNIFISGYTDGSLDGNLGGSDAFFSKYTATGSLAWTKQIGTISNDQGTGLSFDKLGNLYVTGGTRGHLGGTNAGGYDVFVRKYDAAGNVAWTRQFGTNTVDFGTDLSADGLGNIFISGYTQGTLGGPNAGNLDAFISKYDAAGNLAWTRQLGTSADDEAFNVSSDGLGNVYISGTTNGALAAANIGNDDAFISKYDAAGNLAWTRQLGTAAGDAPRDVSADGLGNVYISGYTNGSLGGPNAGIVDAFLSKYDAAGNLAWTKQLGTTLWDESTGVFADGLGNVYISGQTQGALGEPNAGGYDAFVSKYDAAGNLGWTKQWGTSSIDTTTGLFGDGLGNVYISGTTLGSLGGPNVGMGDAFTAKLSAPTQNGGTLNAPPSGILLLEGSSPSNEPTQVLTGGATTSGVQVVVVGGASQGNLLVINGGSQVNNVGDGTTTSTVGGQQVTHGNGYVGLAAGSSGTVTVSGANSEWNNSAQLFVGVAGSATLNVNDNGVVSAPTITIGTTGSVRGSGGTLEGNVVNNGTVAPGNSPGQMTIDGDFANNGILAMELGGTAAASHDKLIVDGNLSFGGTLQVSLVNGYTPSAGNAFNILDFSTHSGQFAQLSLPSLSGLVWDTSQLYTTGVLSVAVTPTGDFNLDGSIDAADYVMWVKTGGTAGDYNTWRQNFGAGAGGGGQGDGRVPEPAGVGMLVLGILAVLFGRRGRRVL